MSQTVTQTEGGQDRLDPTQEQLLEEMCILVDEGDVQVGAASKRSCHQVAGGPPLHRAFSVFVFSPSGDKMLLQCRSQEKITFPLMWTNACCSHPLNTPQEVDAAEGVKKAARRKLGHELGVPGEELPLDVLRYVARIHYKAASDEVWGEHEIDHILIVRKDLTLDINPNEVSEVRHVTRSELAKMLNDAKYKFTPWFRLIWESGRLSTWWDSLDHLEPHVDHDNILRLGGD